VLSDWNEFKERGKIHQKVLEYRIPAENLNSVLSKAEGYLADVTTGLAAGQQDENLWLILQVSLHHGIKIITRPSHFISGMIYSGLAPKRRLVYGW